MLFLPPSDAYVRSFLYLFYTLIKLYYTKVLSDQASSLAPDWILLLQGPRIPASLRDSTTTFQYQILDGASSLLHGCHSRFGGGVSSPIVGLEVLRVQFNKYVFKCIFCIKGSEHGSKWGLCSHREPMHCPCRHPQFFLSAARDCVPFFVVFISDLMLGWGLQLEHCDCWKQSGCATVWDLGCHCDFKGTVCPWSYSKLGCEVGSRELLLGKEPLHIPPQRLSAGNLWFHNTTWWAYQQRDPPTMGPTPTVHKLTMGSEF